jgi:hypothetical protein
VLLPPPPELLGMKVAMNKAAPSLARFTC